MTNENAANNSSTRPQGQAKQEKEQKAKFEDPFIHLIDDIIYSQEHFETFKEVPDVYVRQSDYNPSISKGNFILYE